MEARVPARLSAREGRRFAFTVGLAFVVLSLIALWRDHDLAARVLSAPGILLLSAGVLVPTRLGPVERAWMNMALAISRITTPILLGIVYFGVITPTGFAARLLGHRALTHVAREDSYWKAPASGGRSDLARQF